MSIFLFLNIWLTLILLTNSSGYFLNLSEQFQSQCLLLLSDRAPLFRDLSQATLCGLSSPDNQFKSAYESLGLSHILVVSGAHFQFLLSLLQKLRFFEKRPRLVFFALSLYTLISGAEPPILRAWFQLLLDKFCFHYKFKVTDALLVQISSFMALPFALLQDKEFSLILSWAASAALTAPKLNNWQKLLLIQFIVSLITEAWFVQDVLFNFLLGPILGPLLLPATTMMLPFPFLDFIWEPLLQAKLSAMTSIAQIPILPKAGVYWPDLYFLKFLIPILLCTFLHTWQIHLRQRNHYD